MKIPLAWTRATANATFPDGRELPVTVWGWGDNAASAKTCAADRLHRAVERIRNGKSFPHDYGYDTRPMKEEILRTFDGVNGNGAAAIVTRNRHGALVLNAAHTLFLDVDLPQPGIGHSLRRLFGGPPAEEKALTALRDTLTFAYGHATFRIYRTAWGLRAMAIDREFDPTGNETQELMRATKTDPAFAKLCQVQKSFRARLTPKPWRCDVEQPPGKYPREDAEIQQRFAEWVREYESAAQGYATCRYLETVGNGGPSAVVRPLLALHDQLTRCEESLPLA